MASKHPLKTLIWIDASQVRRVLMTEVLKSEGIEAFFFSHPKELSVDVLKSLAPSLIIMHSDFKENFGIEALQEYQNILISLGEFVEDFENLELPIEPLTVTSKILSFVS